MARLRKEYKEIQRLVEEAFSRNDRLDPSIMHTALGLLSSKDDPEAVPFRVFPLEDNFLEWHFTILGPSDSPYSGGLYHGRLQFPPDYPFSPPNLYFSTTSGRFQTGAKICLSVTGFHPEHWQPAWGPRTMLMAIREHFTVEDAAAIGYVSMDARDRRILALK